MTGRIIYGGESFTKEMGETVQIGDSKADRAADGLEKERIIVNK